MPEIGLVTDVGSQKHYVENCILYLPKDADRAFLVPDGFKMGAYRLDNALNLRYRQNAPRRTFEAAREDVIRAYQRLSSIQAEQWERGDVFETDDARDVSSAALLRTARKLMDGEIFV